MPVYGLFIADNALLYGIPFTNSLRSSKYPRFRARYLDRCGSLLVDQARVEEQHSEIGHDCLSSSLIAENVALTDLTTRFIVGSHTTVLTSRSFEPDSLSREIVLRANSFAMDFKPDVKFHSYSAKISPEPEPRRFLLNVWKQISAISAIRQVSRVATDNATELVTLGDILPLSALRIRVDDGANGHKDYRVDLSSNTVIDHKDIISGLRNEKLHTIIENEAIVKSEIRRFRVSLRGNGKPSSPP